jgi:hypothetical protein
VHCLKKSAVPSLFAGGGLASARPEAPVDTDGIRRSFFQRNFSKFVPVTFQKDPRGEAMIQVLPVHANLMQFGDKYYCGFRFTVPEWLDGDFEWLHVLDKSESQKNFSTAPDSFGWYIIPQDGKSDGFEDYETCHVQTYPDLEKRFPYTHTFFTQGLDMARLQPGKTYAIWFGFLEKDLPDIAFAMTVSSARGEAEFGKLPLH